MSARQPRVTPKRPIEGFKKQDYSTTLKCQYPECKKTAGIRGMYAYYGSGKLKWICYSCAHTKAVII